MAPDSAGVRARLKHHTTVPPTIGASAAGMALTIAPSDRISPRLKVCRSGPDAVMIICWLSWFQFTRLILKNAQVFGLPFGLCACLQSLGIVGL